MSSEAPLVRVENLKVHFPVRLGAFGERSGLVQAVDDISFDVHPGETLSLVGESGCGKSTTGFATLNLNPVTDGRVLFRGDDISRLDDKAMRPYRQKMQIVFQDPYSTLNPRMTVGEAILEPIQFKGGLSKAEARAELDRILSDVGLPRRFAQRYPHELSGGQRQRVAIARALACRPDFIVCDEAISALDVSIQAQIVNLFMDLQERYGISYLFIAHDLAVVHHISDRVGVMYLGRMAELAPRDAIFAEPLHPYTRALLSAVPLPDPAAERTRKRQVLTGDVPSPLNPPTGCRFHTRCPLAKEVCKTTVPEWREARPDHFVACHLVDETPNTVEAAIASD